MNLLGQSVSVGAISGFLGDRVQSLMGDISTTVTTAAPILPGRAQALSFLKSDQPNAWASLHGTASTAVLVESAILPEMPSAWAGPVLIFVLEPRLEFARVLAKFFAPPKPPAGVHALARVSSGASLGKGCTIEAGALIEDDVEIGDGTLVGANTVLRSGTRIGRGVRIGPNCAIGEGGFGYVRDTRGSLIHMPHSGGVLIGDDVEIGAFTAVDRGTLSDTIIESGAKLDKYVYVAHNCRIGPDALVIGATTLGGGAVIGARAWIAPNSTIKEKVLIGDDATVGLATSVLKDVKPGETVFGNPGRVVGRPSTTDGNGFPNEARER